MTCHAMKILGGREKVCTALEKHDLRVMLNLMASSIKRRPFRTDWTLSDGSKIREESSGRFRIIHNKPT